jgi:hypothetical protein
MAASAVRKLLPPLTSCFYNILYLSFSEEEAEAEGDESAARSSAGSLYNLPPGITDPSALSNNPILFKSFVPISAAGGVAAFFPAPKFMGTRPGYFFGVGHLGLGYYLDSRGDPKLLSTLKGSEGNSSSNSSKNNAPVKKKGPPKGPPPAWAMQGQSVAPSAS